MTDGGGGYEKLKYWMSEIGPEKTKSQILKEHTRARLKIYF